MCMLWWIYVNIRRDCVRNNDIHERLGVAPIEKFVQHHLRWFVHIQQRPTKAPVHRGVIRWTGNKRRYRGRSNLTCKKSIKRDLKDWSITQELALDRREWKVVIHMSESWSSVPFLLLHFYQSFFSIYSPFFAFS
jgi:hypothetical protein